MEPSADEKQVGGGHYKNMLIQPWKVMEHILTHEEFVGFLKGNIIKYSLRAGNKENSSAAEDIQKAYHYIQKLTEITQK